MEGNPFPMKIVILAGGSGTRLWPLSRVNFPKQFLPLADRESLLAGTARRFSRLAAPHELFVLTVSQHVFTVRDQLGKVLGEPFDNTISEPEERGTGPAIVLALRHLIDNAALADDEPVLFTPADHLVEDGDEAFTAVIRKACEALDGRIVLFGVPPRRAEAEYGYIRPGAPSAGLLQDVSRFVEKPDQKTADGFFKDGDCLWNSGILLGTAAAFRAALENAPELAAAFAGMDQAALVAGYKTLPALSFDHAVLNRAANLAVVRLPVAWNDVGYWDSVYEALPHDGGGNAVLGDACLVGTRDSLVISQSGLTGVLGVENLVIVTTADAVLVADRSRSQEVRGLVRQLRERNRQEVFEHVTHHTPWGSFTVLESGPRYKIKRLVVNSGKRLSLQRHRHRSEHWVVIGGTAEVTIGSRVEILHENESVYVPISEVHRLANPGKIPLEIIEVQNGAYLGDDDIERVEDDYGRIV
jgi:mannose-1-phosphate guanylyltransferase/mannose-6-phosphate isomerase